MREQSLEHFTKTTADTEWQVFRPSVEHASEMLTSLLFPLMERAGTLAGSPWVGQGPPEQHGVVRPWLE